MKMRGHDDDPGTSAREGPPPSKPPHFFSAARRPSAVSAMRSPSQTSPFTTLGSLNAATPPLARTGETMEELDEDSGEEWVVHDVSSQSLFADQPGVLTVRPWGNNDVSRVIKPPPHPKNSPSPGRRAREGSRLVLPRLSGSRWGERRKLGHFFEGLRSIIIDEIKDFPSEKVGKKKASSHRPSLSPPSFAGVPDWTGIAFWTLVSRR